MTLNELMEIIEIENLDEFEFFEHFSALMECPEEIEFDLFTKVLLDVDASLLAELTDNYFEDIMQGVPDDAMNLYTMLYSLRSALCDAAKESTSTRERAFYIEELYRFRNWYIFDAVVKCKRLSDGLAQEETFFDALALYRLEKLGEEKYDYDFSHAVDYSIDDYSSTGIVPDFDNDFDEDVTDDLAEDPDVTLIDDEYPVMDDEMSDYDDDLEGDALDEDY
jgi:hypothetical protein